jgi:UDP-3-O-[3-hydroxymyristoyl] glucosamine N-acyltransferase
MLLSEIAKLLEIDYSGSDCEITKMSTLSKATHSDITFLSEKRYIKELEGTKAGAIIVDPSLSDRVPSHCAALITTEPYLKMALLSKYFAPAILDENAPAPIVGENCRISPKAHLENGVVIGNNCTIMAGAYVGLHVSIGDNTTIYPNATIYAQCHIGNACIIHAGAVIGSDGFGFAHTATGEHVKIYQNGNVILEDDVEIGANSTIDCAVFGSTIIKTGAKIDNLVQIGHNCVVGEYSLLVSQVGLAGSTTLGRNVVIGGQSATAGHLNIAPFTTFAARSGVTKDIKESGQTFAGFPLMEHRKWLKLQGRIAKLLK